VPSSTKTALMRFARPAGPGLLPAILTGQTVLRDEPLELDVDLSPVMEVIRRMEKECPGKSKIERAKWDREMAPILHACLEKIPRRLASDARFWHWLCTGPLSRFVWLRWVGEVPEDVHAACKPSIVGRFLGGNSLNGFSRNALARLWWVAETFGGDGEMISKAFERQDLFQAIFERRLGLHPPAARACLEELHDASTAEFRARIKRLNHHLSTIVLEVLDELEIGRQLMS